MVLNLALWYVLCQYVLLLALRVIIGSGPPS
jgi:hypothetical protein